MRVAAYVRVSTDEQADKGNSIFEQQERLTAYCKAMNWSAPEFYIDEGYSAKNLKRPAIANFLNDITSLRFDVILCTKLDRICRNLVELLQLVELFQNYNCRLVSASESFDTSTAAGRMVLQLLGMFAEFERERISERVRDNMKSIAKNTSRAMGKACFGYDVVDGGYVINETEAEQVRWMFDLAEAGHGHRMIAKLLNERGVLTKAGKPWDQVNVKRLMTNETLKGARIYNKRNTTKGQTKMREKSEWIVTEQNHQAIITPEQFDRVQLIFDGRKRNHARAESETYLLTGVIYCKLCGGRMKGSTARYKGERAHHVYYRYICSRYVGGYGCRHHAVDRDQLEQFVIEQIKSIASATDEQIEIMVGKSKTNEDEIKQTQEQLVKIDKRMQKQIEAFENDLISARDLKLARERIEQERVKLEQYMHDLKSRHVVPDEIRRTTNYYMNQITGDNRQKAKQSISMLIDRVVIDAPNVDIYWRL